MDLFEKFDSRIDAAQLDPRPAAKEAVRRIVEFVTRGIPESIAARILESRLAALADRIALAVERGNFSAVHALVDGFETELIGAVRDERERGALKPITPESELARIAPMLAARLYNSIEAEGTRLTLKPDERILDVGFWHIRTTERVISRDELRAAARPVTHRRDDTWAAQFANRQAIEDAEAEAQRGDAA